MAVPLRYIPPKFLFPTAIRSLSSKPSGPSGASLCPDPATVTTPRRLYKFLHRQTELLPGPAASFYKDSIRRGYGQHTDETDPERISQIIERAIQDAKWIVEKYSSDKK